MAATPNVTRVLGRRHDQIELALAAVRKDHTLDDRQKGQRITQMIAVANARVVEILARNRRLAASVSA